MRKGLPHRWRCCHAAPVPTPEKKAGAVMRVTFGNLKGGVGKSTSSVYTALGLAAAGGRVLLVDADGTNRTCLKWSSMAEDWPPSVTVVSWEVPDLDRAGLGGRGRARAPGGRGRHQPDMPQVVVHG